MADVKNHSTLPTSLVSYWELEESSGTRTDSHGSNDLTDNNTVGQGTGKQGNCADFESTNSEYLSIADASQTGLDPSGDHSWSFWVKLESLPAFTMFLSKFGTTTSTRSYRAYYKSSDSTIQFEIRDSSSNNTYHNVVNTLSLDTWHHIVATWDWSAEVCKIYVDGVLQAGNSSGNSATSINNSVAPFQLGGETGSGLYTDGLIDEVGFWSKELTSSEVTDLYNSGDGLPYEATTAAEFIPKVMMF